MDVGYFIVAIALSVGSIVAYLLLRDRVIQKTRQERTLVQQELARLGKSEKEIRDLVRTLDRCRVIEGTYHDMVKWVLVSAALWVVAGALAISDLPAFNPMNLTGACLGGGILALIYVFTQLWQLMKSLGP